MMMIASGCFTLVVVLAQFAHAVPVPAPEEVHHPAEYGQTGQMVAVQLVQSADEPVPAVGAMTAVRTAAAVRPARSASPFFGIITGGYEKPYKKQHHHHHQYHHQEEPEPTYHRPQYHKPQHQQQHHGGGGGSQAGSFASAGSFAGGHGGGNSQSQSSANSQTASFGFGPFQASYSASSAQSGSHSGGKKSPDYY